MRGAGEHRVAFGPIKKPPPRPTEQRDPSRRTQQADARSNARAHQKQAPTPTKTGERSDGRKSLRVSPTKTGKLKRAQKPAGHKKSPGRLREKQVRRTTNINSKSPNQLHYPNLSLENKITGEQSTDSQKGSQLRRSKGGDKIPHIMIRRRKGQRWSTKGEQ